MQYRIPICLLFFICCATFFSSCEQPRQTETEITNISFEVTDSLIVDVLGNLELMDINDAQNRFLLYDYGTSDIIVTDENGAILHRYNKEGDKPDSYGSFKISRAAYINDTEYLMPGMQGVFHYNINGKLIEKLPLDFEPGFRMSVGSARNIQSTESKVVLIMPGREQELDENSRHQLELIDLDERRFSPILPFPKDSKFGGDKYFDPMHTRPVFNFSNNQLLLTFANEAKLFLYSGNNFTKPDTAYALEPEIFYEYEGYAEPNTKGEMHQDRFYYGSYHQIAPMGDYIYTRYNTGVAPQKVREIINSTEPWSDEFNKAINAEMESYSQLFKDGKKIGSDFKLPDYLGSVTSAFDQENIWITANQSFEEKDYYVLYKARLVLE